MAKPIREATGSPPVIQGTTGNDKLHGGLLDDLLRGSAGDDTIDGKNGFDTALYSGSFFDYSFEFKGNGKVLVTGPDGTDTLKHTEALKFDGNPGATFNIGDGTISVVPGSDHTTTVVTIDDVSHDNPSATSETSPIRLLPDGTAFYTEVRAGSISTAPIVGGGDDGAALRLETDSNDGRLRANVLFDSDNQFELGELDVLSFDYLIAQQDPARTDVSPVLRLMIDADGDLSTTGDRGELVFEYAYQGYPAASAGTWGTTDIAGDDLVLWQRSNGHNWDQISNMTTLSDWQDADGFTPVGGLNFDADSVVLGFSVGLGSSNGTQVMYVDNVEIGTTGAATDNVTSYMFV